MKNTQWVFILLCVLFSQQTRAQFIDWHNVANPLGFQTNGVKYTANGQRVLTGTDCHPSKMRLFNATNGNLDWDYTLSNNLMCVMGVGAASNGNYLAGIEEFGNLLIFDNTVWPPDSINTIVMGTTYAFSLDFSPVENKIAVGGSNGKLLVIDMATNAILHTVNAHSNWVTTTCYAPGGTRIVTGGNDAKIKIWDTSGANITTLSGHTQQVTKVLISSDGNTIYSSSYDNTIKIWSVPGDSLITTINVSSADVNAIALSPAGDMLAAVSSDHGIRFYNTSTFQLTGQIFESAYGYGISVDWSPVNAQVAVGTEAGKVVAFNVQKVLAVNMPVINGDISIYPNPVNDRFYIQSNLQNDLSYYLSNASGQIVKNGPIVNGKNEIAIADIAPGIYFVELRNKQGVVIGSQKINKQ